MSESERDHEITRLLEKVNDGDQTAYGELMRVVQEQLKLIAQARLRHERPGHTLQATALLGELHIKFAGLVDIKWRDRKHFFGAASANIRRILIDYARRYREGGKRPRPVDRRELDEQWASPSGVDLADLVSLDDALIKLAELDGRQAQIVEMKYFGGMTVARRSPRCSTSPSEQSRATGRWRALG